jgi:hypothetical protein
MHDGSEGNCRLEDSGGAAITRYAGLPLPPVLTTKLDVLFQAKATGTIIMQVKEAW